MEGKLLCEFKILNKFSNYFVIVKIFFLNLFFFIFLNIEFFLIFDKFNFIIIIEIVIIENYIII